MDLEPSGPVEAQGGQAAGARRVATSRRPHRRQDWTNAATLAAIVVVAAIAARVLDQPTLRVAVHQAVEGVALRALARDFSRRYDVSVELFELPYAALYEAEMRAVSAEHPDYDVIMVDDPWLPALIGEDEDGQRTRLERLEFTPEECEIVALGDFIETTLQVSVHPRRRVVPSPGARAEAGRGQCGTAIDGLYALPMVGNSQLFLVRRGLERQPETWDDVEEVSDTTAITDAGYVARVGSGNSIVTDFMSVLWTLPGRMPDPATSLAALRPSPTAHFPLGQEQARPSFEFVKNLGANQRANRAVISADDFDLAIHLVNEKASMMIAWSAWVMALAKLPPPHNAHLLELDPGVPAAFSVTQVPGGAPVLGAWLLAIPARSPNQDLARQFLLWATAKEQTVAAATLGNPPTRRSTFTARSEPNDPSAKRLNELYPFFDEQLASLQRAQARPRTPFWRAIETVLGECLTTLYEGGIDPDEAWERVDAGLQVLREKQERIDAARGRRQEIRAILDEPIPPFSCSDRS